MELWGDVLFYEAGLCLTSVEKGLGPWRPFQIRVIIGQTWSSAHMGMCLSLKE